MVLRIGIWIGDSNMASTLPALGLEKYKNSEEQFIYSIDGTLKFDIIQDAFYSMLPYPPLSFLPIVLYTISIDCTLAITDKRIIILEKDSYGNVYEPNKHVFNYNEINLEFKRSLGNRKFIIDKIKKGFFKFYDDTLIVEINSKNIKQADNIYSILSAQKLVNINR
jgi:hypothetical protein